MQLHYFIVEKKMCASPQFSLVDQGLDDELRIEAKLSSEEKLEQQKQDDIFNPAIYVLTNKNGLKGIWDKMFHQEYSKFTFKHR